MWQMMVNVPSTEPPAKRPKILQDDVDIFYANVTQWNKEVFQWLIQQDLQVVMMVETHLAGELCRSRWQPAFMEQEGEAPAVVKDSAVEKAKRHTSCTSTTVRATASLPMWCNDRSGRCVSSRYTSSAGKI